ncbi:MAG: hypothetical protein WC438_04185 [Candidatus Pacearchaeota archaeon]
MGEIDKIITEISPYYQKKKGPSDQQTLTYEFQMGRLEQVYYWVLDFMNGMFGGDVTKLIDNFSSSPGSGQFAEISRSKSYMQQETSRVLGTVSTILQGVMRLLYDLKEFQIRLSHYDDANSEDKTKKESGILALKQIWLDKVDIQRGNGSIHAMTTSQLNFVTLRDSFMYCEKPEDVDRLDLNERVKRVLKPRVSEFIEWRKRSEQQLRREFEIEKTYLRTQVNALKLNARWAKPYLKAAQKLEGDEKLGENPAMVGLFNTLLFELTLMGKSPVDVKDAVIAKDLPPGFINDKKFRKYYSIVIIDFNFRSSASSPGQPAYFSGRADVTFKAYALNEDELKLFKKKLDSSDLNDALKLIQGMTDDSLLKLNEDIESFLEPEKKKKEEDAKKTEEDINPFSALFNFFKKEEKKDKKEEDKLKDVKDLKKDSYAEKYIRSLAEANAINSCFTVFDIYKKAHGMASFPYSEEAEAEAPRTTPEKWFGLK